MKMRVFSPLSAFGLTTGLALALAVAGAGSAWGQTIPAFPGAEGYGAYAKGGRGGDVYTVTNLNSSGAGSLADGIAGAPTAGRTIVFAVSGYIHVNGLRITKSNITIAGQTAPGDGISTKDGTFRISGDEIVIRHLRFRHGKYGSGGDCVDLDSGSLNAILDQCSLQFSTDENISSFGSPPENLTMQWSLNGWGLESHSCGGLWDQNHATCHHSLWAHNHTRNPKSRPNGLLEWTNNVTFDWDIGFIMGDSTTPASWKANVRNSYFLCPAGNLRSRALEKASLDRNGVPNFSLYLNGCRHDNDGNGLLDGTDKGYGIVSGTYTTLAAPVAGSTAGVVMDDAVTAFKKVASRAGALRLELDPAKPLRDEVDTVMIQNLLTQKRNHITGEASLPVTNAGFGTLASTPAPLDTDKDGMPDFYETALGWAPATQDHNTALPNGGGLVTGTTFFPAGTPAGYTRLEEYLHYLAIPHGTVAKNTTTGPTSVTVTVSKFTAGFVKNPVYSVSGAVNGTAVQTVAGGPQVVFTPTLNAVGRGRFEFTVTDADGSTWTQTCALVITNSGLPRDLKWKGDGTVNVWDGTAANWLRNWTATAFGAGDRVTLDDTGSRTPAVAVTGTVSPGSVEVDTAAAYTFSGAGGVSSTGPLKKTGAGTLTLANTGANSFASATLTAGTLVMGSGASLGTAPLTLEGGTWNIGANAPTGNAITMEGPATITGGSGGGATGIGAVTGAATLSINATNVFDLRGDMTGFTGRVLFTGNSLVRLNGSAGSAAATYDLGTGTGSLAKRSSGTGVTLGGLAGGATTNLSGATGTGNTSTTTYTIGANGQDTTFAGVIANGAAATGITKTGGGTLTLTGASTYTGATLISSGGLAVNGTLGATAVTVASGARLRGAGTVNGGVTAQSGSSISPGAATGLAGTLTVAGGLALQGTTLSMQLSSSLTAGNDKIAMNGGTLALTGTNGFNFTLPDTLLSAGTYDLITGGAATTGGLANLSHNLPAGGRQTFALDAATPGRVKLNVTGDAASLVWRGNLSAVWDVNTTANWLNGAAAGTFYNLDGVTINDTAVATSITLPAMVQPRSTLVNNTTKAITLAGGLGGTGVLTKTGTATLSLTGTNTYSGGTQINGGTISLANDTAVTGGLGTGTVTFNGGTLALHDDSASYNSWTADLLVPAGQTGRINADSRVDIHGTLTGGGVLNFFVPYTRTSLYGDWSAFTGVLNVISDAGGGDLRFASDYTVAGLPQADVALGANCFCYHAGTLASGTGTQIELGSLSGPATAHLRGGVTGGRGLTWRIGGKNTDAVFAGDISEQNTGTTTSLVKAGTGTWTLSGACNHAGGTVVEAGALRVGGVLSTGNTINVATSAGLFLDGGSLVIDALNVDTGAGFTGWGTVTGDVNLSGTWAGRGAATGTTSTLAVTGVLTVADGAVMRFRVGTPGSDRITVTGDAAVSGQIALTVPAGFTGGRVVLISATGELTTEALTLTGVPAGTQAALDTATPGQVAVVFGNVTPYQAWQTTWWGGTTSADAQPDADPDRDGLKNLVEFALGLAPKTPDNEAPLTASLTHEQPGLISSGAVWHFRDAATAPAGTWTTAAYDDSAWATGRALLGYGDTDTVTTLGYGPSATDKYPAAWFRRTFSVVDPAHFTALAGSAIRDDGIVVWLNGTEVGRDNLTAGSTFATTAISGTAERTPWTFAPAPAALQPGLNVIAVEVRQSAADSSDLAFDLSLTGTLAAGVTAGDYLTLRWVRSGAALSGVTTTVEASSSLSGTAWTPVARTPRVLSSDSATNSDVMEVIDDAPVTAGGRRFLRLRFTLVR